MEVENYLNSIKTLSASFVQSSIDESSYGTIQLKKPGKVRVLYLSPKNFVIVIKKNRAIYYDYELEEYANFPNKLNFLSIISQENFSFAEIEKYNLAEKGDFVYCMVEFKGEESSEPILVNLILERNANLLKFYALEINDGISPVTTMKFTNIELNKPISERQFKMRNPNFFKK